MVKSKSDPERHYQSIIDAAYDLFVEQGFHATSMRRIAQRANVSLGGIYNHFDTKDQIFDKVILEKHPYRQILADLQSAPGDTLDDFIRNAAHVISTEIGKRPEFLQLLFIELNEFRGKHVPVLMQILYPQFLPLLQRVEKGQGQLRDLPPQVIVLSFAWILLAHFLVEASIDPDSSFFFRPGKLEHYLDIFMLGIFVPVSSGAALE